MNPSSFPRQAQVLTVGLLAFALISCVASPIATEQVVENNAPPTGYPALETTNALTPLALPTWPGGTPNPYYSYFATPDPKENVGVANIIEQPNIVPSPTYTFEMPRVDVSDQRVTVLYIIHPQTGEKIRLGDDTGSALMGAMNAEVVAWHFACKTCLTIKAGLHLYTFADGKDTWVDDHEFATLGTIELRPPWVVYRKASEPRLDFSAQLYVYNYVTGQIIFVAKNARDIRSGVLGYVAVSENKVAWMETGATAHDNILSVFDLTTQTNRQIPADLFDPRYLVVSKDVVVWWDT